METRQDKIKMLKRFTEQTLQRITENSSEYKQFLSFQSRLHKHKFEDSLLIYAQNPDAIACATYNQWHNKRVNRRIHRGSKGIALFADEHGKKLKHVFALNQTYGKAFTFPVQYTIPEQYQSALIHNPYYIEHCRHCSIHNEHV